MARIKNANYLDNYLKHINQIYIPEREKNSREVFHLYCIQAKKRDKLVRFLMSKGIDAKKHYPVPMHLQKPSKQMFGYKKGDFPMAEKLSDKTLSLPVHEFITKKQLDFVIDQINLFYSKKINS